jgi:serine protease inhibitor
LGGTLESGSEKLKVSGVMQKAVIEVSEKSTEAAATSSITISNRYKILLFNLTLPTEHIINNSTLGNG